MFVVLFSSFELMNNTDKNLIAKNSKGVIEKVLNTWHKHTAEANFEGYFNAMIKSWVFIGVDASEN
jgi:hypothetical protein